MHCLDREDPLTWKSQQQGGIEWSGMVPGLDDIHVWIQPRQPYCDRGHWDWGWEAGIPVMSPHRPSYYFMRWERAQAEIERFLARSSGCVDADTPLIEALPQSFSFSGSNNGAWTKNSPTQIQGSPLDQNSHIKMIIDQHLTDEGPVWILTQENCPDIDGSDAFPRTYLQLDTALKETEEFLAWRLDKVPAQRHVFEYMNTVPVGPNLSEALASSSLISPRTRGPG